jgi:hypothetical protein
MYGLAAVSGGLLFVLCAALLALFSPRAPFDRTIPTEIHPPATAPVPGDTVIQPPPLVARAEDHIKLIAVKNLLENREENPQALRSFIDQAGLEKKYPLGFALFYSDSRKTLYYGRSSNSDIIFDPSSLKISRIGDAYCMNILPLRIGGKLLDNISNNCFGPQVSQVIRPAIINGIIIEIEPLVSLKEGAAWVVGAREQMKPAR